MYYSISSLPEELHSHILSFQEVSNLKTFGQVCSLWKKLTDQADLWRRYFPMIEALLPPNVEIGAYIKKKNLLKEVSILELCKVYKEFCNSLAFKTNQAFICIFPLNENCSLEIKCKVSKDSGFSDAKVYILSDSLLSNPNMDNKTARYQYEHDFVPLTIDFEHPKEVSQSLKLFKYFIQETKVKCDNAGEYFPEEKETFEACRSSEESDEEYEEVIDPEVGDMYELTFLDDSNYRDDCDYTVSLCQCNLPPVFTFTDKEQLDEVIRDFKNDEEYEYKWCYLSRQMNGNSAPQTFSPDPWPGQLGRAALPHNFM